MSVVAGYLVRYIDEEATIKEVLYNKEEHKVYKTFNDALKKAQELANRESITNYRKCMCLIRAKSEESCTTLGHIRAYEFTNSGLSIIIFALYEA